MAKVKVLEVNQHLSTGSGIKGTRIEDWEKDPEGMMDRVTGGDSEASKRISGGYARVKEVEKGGRPFWGHVWFRPDENGLLRLWSTNYDSSG